jgi:hypothetical protein
MDTLELTTPFFTAVKSYITKNRQIFNLSPNRIISDFQGEEGLMKAYNGRQLLEILQNADDARANKAKISLDTARRELTFSNTGDPFSPKGIGSLMIRDLSEKRGKRRMIGNKGLGFRSILTWAEKIVIQTAGYRIEFSPEIAAREFLLAVPDKTERDELLAEYGYKDDAVPFPFLGIPDIDESDESEDGWDTVITVYYKSGSEKYILPQLKEFKPEILIFLNHIEELSISYPGTELIIPASKRETGSYQSDTQKITLGTIQLQEKSWEVYSITAKLPKTYEDTRTVIEEYYSIRVAISPELNDTYFKLFCFFPTQLSIYLPCLVHGTFDLDPSRNHLTGSERNVFLFEQLGDLFKSAALRLAGKKTGWQPYRLLTPTVETSDDPKVVTFYKALKETKKALKIYPCVDGQFRTLQEAVNHGQELSDFIMRHNLVKEMDALLLSFDAGLEEDKFLKDHCYYYTDDYLVATVNQVGKMPISNKVRAQLIGILCAASFRSLPRKKKFAILTNREKKTVPAEWIAFTPATKEKEFYKPDYVDLDFINKDLYAQLLEEFEIAADSQAPRELQRKLVIGFNMQSYEPAPVITSYITTAIQKLKTAKPRAALLLIREMVKALYSVYRVMVSGTISDNSRLDDLMAAGIPLISRSGKIIQNNQLIFGREYADGALAEDLFRGIYNGDNYLTAPEKWALGPPGDDDLSAFFTWLKVGSYSQLEKWNEQGWENTQDPYIRYVLQTQFRPPFFSYIKGTGQKVKGIDTILAQVGNGVSREQLLAWVIKDTKIMQDLAFPKNKLVYSFSTRELEIKPKHSYIRWQFLQAGLFNNFVIEEKYQAGVNDFTIKLDAPIFTANHIGVKEIEDALLLLGAKRSFEELPVARVFQLLARLEKDDPERKGKNTMALYKLALKNFGQPGNREVARKNLKVKIVCKKRRCGRLYRCQQGLLCGQSYPARKANR